MDKKSPLAYSMRPASLEEFVGQEHLMAKGKPLRKMIESGNVGHSIILWGPPGCGKTTIARLVSRLTQSEFVELSAVNASRKDIEKAINKAGLFNKRVILFLDEIHRFNKAQQDFLLPHVERGTIILIGATTENPSFEVISALLSRSRVFVLEALTKENISKILERVVEKKKDIKISKENIDLIANLSNGDARTGINILELSFDLSSGEISKDSILAAVQKSHLRYDGDGEEHYNIISALHKSMRDSDVQASVYWAMRMIEGGEDPKYIVRRMIRFASEDIGNADSEALKLAIAVKESVMFLGYPECDTALIQLASYLAKAPKSNSSYSAVLKLREVIKKTGNLNVPLHLRNAPTKLMKDLGYGKDYKYFHSEPDSARKQEHLPKELKDEVFYEERKDKS